MVCPMGSRHRRGKGEMLLYDMLLHYARKQAVCTVHISALRKPPLPSFPLSKFT